MNASAPYARLVMAGTSGDSGKTLLTMALILTWRNQGLEVCAYKKGPDYIDASWLSWAAAHRARNLDSYLMGFEGCASSFGATASRDGINLIEGNRGIYDGVDARGTHSTAELAKRLAAPVLLLVSATKVTRTAAAVVLGCQRLDPKVSLAGVVLNQVSNARHERIIRQAIEADCGVPVLGSLPKASGASLLPSRHLGLVTPHEHPRIHELEANLLGLIRDRVDLSAILAAARNAPPLPAGGLPVIRPDEAYDVTIGYLTDAALTFYYPENLEALEQAGARLIALSPLTAAGLPREIDALYIGGGFPETHGSALAANDRFLQALRHAAKGGLPIYAECGGLMLLSEAIIWQGQRFPMAGVLPFEVRVSSAVQGHGYTEMVVDRPNPFFPEGTKIRGHEFHYSRIFTEQRQSPTVCSLTRGTGCGEGRDGWVQGNIWASYTHVHALGTPEWSIGLLSAAKQFALRRPN